MIKGINAAELADALNLINSLFSKDVDINISWNKEVSKTKYKLSSTDGLCQASFLLEAQSVDGQAMGCFENQGLQKLIKSEKLLDLKIENEQIQIKSGIKQITMPSKEFVKISTELTSSRVVDKATFVKLMENIGLTSIKQTSKVLEDSYLTNNIVSDKEKVEISCGDNFHGIVLTYQQKGEPLNLELPQKYFGTVNRLLKFPWANKIKLQDSGDLLKLVVGEDKLYLTIPKYVSEVYYNHEQITASFQSKTAKASVLLKDTNLTDFCESVLDFEGETVQINLEETTGIKVALLGKNYYQAHFHKKLKAVGSGEIKLNLKQMQDLLGKYKRFPYIKLTIYDSKLKMESKNDEFHLVSQCIGLF
jgi:hypothetical protein